HLHPAPAGDRHRDAAQARPAGPRHPPAAAAGVRRRRLPAALQPDRHLRARRPPRRHWPDRAQDHRRHLRRDGPPRRRRLLRQGPVEGRPLGRLRHPPGGQGRGRRRPGQALRGPGGLRHRQGPAGLGAGRDVRHRRGRPGAAAGPDRGVLRPPPGRHHRAAGPAPADLPQDRRLRSLRPARQGVHLGAGRRHRRRPPFRRVIGGGPLPSGHPAAMPWGPNPTATAVSTATRVCRVAVDVLAVERLFDYSVPEPLAGVVAVGTIVRVNLGGRRVRGWVVADDVVSEAPPDKLRPLLEAVSAGPSPEVVALTEWAAWRFAGPRLPVLRAASPAAVVPPGNLRSSGTGGVPEERRSSEAPGGEAGELAADAAGREVAVVRWPPAADPGEMVAGLVAPAGSTVVIVPDGRLAGLAAAARAAGAVVVPWLTEGRPRDRARAWDRCRQGGCVVVGGRSAVLAPVPDLAAVVVLDDGAEALKEERSPTWHARDLAAERVRRLGARLTIVSPAPPLEAPGPVLTPSRTAERAGWPITEVIDRRKEPPGLGLFSPRAVAALRAAVEPDRRSSATGGVPEERRSSGIRAV